MEVSETRILHVITGLGQGGAERQLTNLLLANKAVSSRAVFSISGVGEMGKTVRDIGIPIFSGGAGGPYSVRWAVALRGVMRAWRPDLVVGWMYHGNLAASFCRVLGHKGPVVWNVRHSIQDLRLEKAGTRAVIRAGAWFSAGADRIIYNSEAASLQHEALGYRSEQRCVVSNGFDLNRFRPNPVARLSLRKSLGVEDRDLLLGVIGRAHPMKNHVGWVSAFARLAAQDVAVKCVMIGRGIDKPTGPVSRAVRSAGLSDRIHLSSGRADLEAVYPALDLLVLPSLFGEGFPNVVGEAMACGVPALVTDVGGSASVVGKTGFVVEGADPASLADGVSEALRLGSHGLAEMGRLARERVANHFELTKVAQDYTSILAAVLKG